MTRLRRIFSCAKCLAPMNEHGNRRYCDECKDEVKIIRGRASCKVVNAISRGDLPPLSECVCVDCGKPAQVYEHRSYATPLVVVPACKRCNHKRGPAKWGHVQLEYYFLEPAPL